MVFCFLSLTELTRFSISVLCCEVFKFWVNSFDGSWNKDWQEPKLGDSIGNLLGAIFLFTNMICVLLGVSCII